VRFEQHFFDDLADQVTGQDVALLNARSLFRRNANSTIGEILDCAAGSSGQRHGVDGFCLSRLKGPQHVAGISAGGNAHGDVTGFAERFELSFKDEVEAVIVASSCQRRSVGVRRQRRQRTPLFEVAAGEFRGEMLCVGSAAAISKKKNLASSAQRFNNLHRHAGDQHVITGIGQQHTFNFDGTLDARTDQAVHLLYRTDSPILTAIGNDYGTMRFSDARWKRYARPRISWWESQLRVTAVMFVQP